MPKRENIMILDVETAGGFASPLVYDLGIVVAARTSGEILETRSFVLSDVFVDRPRDMRSAYYAEKIPAYHKAIAAKHMKVVDFWTAWRAIRHLVKKYNIHRVYAYNAAFDIGALNNTMKMVTNGKYRNFLPYGMKVCCIWHMACQTILRQKAYRKFAAKNGFVSEFGNIRTTAEVAYAYITKNPNFVEAHTGLSDAVIENAILHHILRQKKRIDEAVKHNCWRIAQLGKEV
jgi:DNA polymerase III epsilon subunit-like protein